MNNQTYMTIKETADFLRVSPKTVARYIREGKLPSTKPGGRRIIPSADVLSFAAIS